MQANVPVTRHEKAFPRGGYLVSKTDLKGVITDANDAFVEMSGFGAEELIGSPRDIVHHPDMPPQVFADLWRTLQHNRPWRGVVKYRCKNGDHYWVDAFVAPLRRQGQPVGYLSACSQPGREQVRQAEALYARLNGSGQPFPRRRNWIGRFSLRARLAAAMAVMAAMMAVGAAVGIGGAHQANQALHDAHEEQMRPAVALARILQRVGENRSQVMLGLQHAPDSPYRAMHDHPLAAHAHATLANQREIDALREEYEKRSLGAEERPLAKAFFEARERYVREGIAPAREALLAGDFARANLLLLARINPLYEALNDKGDTLRQHLLSAGEQSLRDAEARFSLIRMVGIGGAIAAVALVIAVAAFLTRAMIHPIRRTIAHFERISEGDLCGDIEIDRGDETGQLLAALATTQVKLKVMLGDIRAASEAIDVKCAGLNAEMRRVVEQSGQQHDRVQGSAAAAEQFSQSVAGVAASALRTSEVASHSQIKVEESHADMERSVGATLQVVQTVQASSRAITDLDQSIRKIGDITGTIRAIADQTNLLALNAAIEAARAGDSGRGFAVVADEVRKLAEGTARSTAGISAIVAEFQGVTRTAVESMAAAVKQVEGGSAMMRASVTGLEQIRSSSDTAAEMASHIASAAREQAAASEDVAANMARMRLLIGENTYSAERAGEMAEDLAHTAGKLRALVGNFELARA
ncbi:MAG: Tar ligand binding domain-containing protein [Betaproteobacteria bacterium]|nr:Tar ligand binding domain-containing protein [Betaproteobacteria bacterium]